MSAYRVLKIALFVAVTVIIIYAIYGAFFKDSIGRSKSTFSFEEPKKYELKPISNPYEVSLNQILINLGEGDFRYLKSEISVEAPTKQDVKLIQENREILRRLVLEIASHENADHLITPEGKEAFKQRIIDEARMKLGLRISSVYFRNFILAE